MTYVLQKKHRIVLQPQFVSSLAVMFSISFLFILSILYFFCPFVTSCAQYAFNNNTQLAKSIYCDVTKDI